MRNSAQILCVIAIGLGAGMFSVGHYLEPPLAGINPAELAQYQIRSEEVHITASVLRGLGVCFLTTGILGIVIPWINVILFPTSERPTAATPPPPAPPAN